MGGWKYGWRFRRCAWVLAAVQAGSSGLFDRVSITARLVRAMRHQPLQRHFWRRSRRPSMRVEILANQALLFCLDRRNLLSAHSGSPATNTRLSRPRIPLTIRRRRRHAQVPHSAYGVSTSPVGTVWRPSTGADDSAGSVLKLSQRRQRGWGSTQASVRL